MSRSIQNDDTNKRRHVPSASIVSKCYWKAWSVRSSWQKRVQAFLFLPLTAVLAIDGDCIVSGIYWLVFLHSLLTRCNESQDTAPQSDPLTPLPSPHRYGVASNDEHVFSQPHLWDFTLLCSLKMNLHYRKFSWPKILLSLIRLNIQQHELSSQRKRKKRLNKNNIFKLYLLKFVGGREGCECAVSMLQHMA